MFHLSECNSASIVLKKYNLHSSDVIFNLGAEVTDVFGPGRPVTLSDFKCDGTEKELRFCFDSENHACESGFNAGVICLQGFGE